MTPEEIQFLKAEGRKIGVSVTIEVVSKKNSALIEIYNELFDEA